MSKNNPVIEQILHRKSIRKFTGEKIKDTDLELIFAAAQRAPTSINAQQISLVYTKDKEVIKTIASLAGGQPQIECADVFVTIVIDFNRTAHAATLSQKEQVVEQSAEGILVGAVDAGIMLGYLQNAAESLGYGTTAIGGIRNNPEKMIALLNLPPKTYPIVGTTLGVPTKEALSSPLKPRVPLKSFAMENRYNKNAVEDGVEMYEKELHAFREEHHMTYQTSYIEQTAGYYDHIYYPTIGKTLTMQGFKFQDSL